MRKVSLMNKAKNKSCVARETGVHDLDPACNTDPLGSVLGLFPCWNTLILFVCWSVKSEFSFLTGN